MQLPPRDTGSFSCVIDTSPGLGEKGVEIGALCFLYSLAPHNGDGRNLLWNGQRGRIVFGGSTEHFPREGFARQGIGCLDDEGPLDKILHLPNIPWPFVIQERFHHLPARPLDCPMVDSIEPSNEIIYENRNVLPSFP